MSRKEYMTKWRNDNMGHIKLYRQKTGRAYYLKNRENILKKTAEWVKKNKDRCSHNQYMSKYGISYEYYKKLLVQQDNKCAICRQEETKRNKKGEVLPLAVDHCHKTGAVRGLLCDLHNKGIGFFQDSVYTLKSAVTYLENTQRGKIK